MKMRILKLLSITLLSLHSVAAQNIKLSEAEMKGDFNELIAFINDFAVHKDLNSIRLGIDYKSEFEALRNQITSETLPCEFRSILLRATKLVQDLHCGPMDHNYLTRYGKYQNKLNFKSKEKTYEKLKTYESLCPDKTINLKLPVVFSEKKYHVYADFTYQNTLISKGSILTEYNGSSIESFLKNNPDKAWPIKVDEAGNAYNERFYQNGSDSFVLSFEKEGAKKEISFNLTDTIKYLKQPEREITYYSQDEAKIIVSEEHGILYIGLPSMDQSISEDLIKKIDNVASKSGTIEKVVIDIRGNPGGSDLAWRRILKHIIAEPISFEVNLKYRFNNRTIDHYNRSKEVKMEKIDLLDGVSYWSEEKVTITIRPDPKSMNFTDNIYVLQDPYIYSSAGNFSNLCLISEQLISVGARTDLVGKLKKEPLFFQLKNSGLIYRAEPVLDFSNVTQLEDLAHNQVEVYIPVDVEHRYLKSTHPTSIYEEDFLFTRDLLMQYVIGH